MPSSLRSLRRVVRLAQPLPSIGRSPSPASSSTAISILLRRKSTQAAPGGVPPTGQLPFYVTWIGSYLGSSLSRAQRDAFAQQYLPPAAAAVAATNSGATAAPAPAASDASTQRERDAALARIAELEASSSALRSEVTVMQLKVTDEASSGAAQMGVLRTQLKAAEGFASDARVALNALKDQQSKSMAKSQQSTDAVELLVAEAEERATAVAVAKAEADVKRLVAAAEKKANAALTAANAEVAAAEKKVNAALTAANADVAAAEKKANAALTAANAEVERLSAHVGAEKNTADEMVVKAMEDLERRVVAAEKKATAEAFANAKAAAATAARHADDAKIQAVAAATARGDAKYEALMAEKRVSPLHPVFGTLLHDFGYKKVYAMPAVHLVSKDKVMVYEQQRAFRAERAEVIAAEKSKEASFSIPGVISIAEGIVPVKAEAGGAESGESARRTVSILDGQHRVGALKILLKNKVLTKGDQVLVEVFPDVDEKRAVDLFMEINSAQPIRFVDLPGVTTPDVKWMLEGAMQRLKEAHPAMFRPSPRCMIPTVNLDNMREELFTADVMTRFSITTEEGLAAWLSDINQGLAARSNEEWLATRPNRGRGSSVSTASYLKAINKARENDFFLGMDFTWLDI